MLKLGLVILVVFVAQAALTYLQVNDYRRAVSEVSRLGNLFIGHQKGRIKAGSIVIMAVDSEGFILDSRSMTGITVFNRFKPIKGMIGLNLYESELWLNNLKNKQIAKAIKNGIEAIEVKQRLDVDN